MDGEVECCDVVEGRTHPRVYSATCGLCGGCAAGRWTASTSSVVVSRDITCGLREGGGWGELRERQNKKPRKLAVMLWSWAWEWRREGCREGGAHGADMMEPFRLCSASNSKKPSERSMHSTHSEQWRSQFSQEEEEAWDPAVRSVASDGRGSHRGNGGGGGGGGVDIVA